MKKILITSNSCTFQVEIDPEKPAKCRECGEEIYFATTHKGKLMPVQELANGSWESHFAHCPFADRFRK